MAAAPPVSPLAPVDPEPPLAVSGVRLAVGEAGDVRTGADVQRFNMDGSAQE